MYDLLKDRYYTKEKVKIKNERNNWFIKSKK
jgi:hypothetical protein